MPCREPFLCLALRLTAQCHINRDLRLRTGSFDPQHFPEWLHLLVSLSAAGCSPALIAAIPGASDIDNLETQHKSRFTHLHSTLLPQVTGRRNRRRLASPLHGTLTPGRISVGRPPFGRTGVSLSLTESSQNSLPSAVFGRVGTARHLSSGPLIEASREIIPPSFPLLLQMVLAHPPLSLAPLIKRPRQ